MEEMAKIEGAVAAEKLLESSAANIRRTLGSATSPVAVLSIAELVEGGEWMELNDRFYRSLAFGTGGIRGRTVGKIVTRAERGTPNELGRPQFPCVGTNAMNFESVARATQGLAEYLCAWFAREGRNGRPKVVIAHDTRFFSTDFTKLAAEDRGPKRLRRLYLPWTTVNSGTFLRGSLPAGKRGCGGDREP